MKKTSLSLISKLAVVAGLCVSSSAFAVNTYSGTIGLIGTDWYGTGFVFSVNGVTSACASGQFSMSASAAGYKDNYATLMLAKALGKTVSVAGDGTCPNSREAIIGISFN